MSCPDCFSGHQHDGQPVGKMMKLHGLDTYVVEPAEGRKVRGIIVYIPDAFGIAFVNNKLLADAYARKGDYKVYLPDFMLGHSCPSWFLDTMKALVTPGQYLSKPYHVFWGIYAFVPWLYFCRPARTFPTVRAFFAALGRAEGAALPVGAAGFCWGGKHAVSLTHAENYASSSSSHNLDNDSEGAAAPRPLLDAAFVGHPSFLALPRDVARITVPTSFALPAGDHHVKVPRDSDVVRRILEEELPGGRRGPRGEVRIYEGCAHGFCVRADPLSGDVARQAAEAEDQAVAWFNAKLGVAVD